MNDTIPPLTRQLNKLIADASAAAAPRQITLRNGLTLAVRIADDHLSLVGWRADGITAANEAGVVRAHLVAACQLAGVNTAAVTIETGDWRIAGAIRRAWRIRAARATQLALL